MAILDESMLVGASGKIDGYVVYLRAEIAENDSESPHGRTNGATVEITGCADDAPGRTGKRAGTSLHDRGTRGRKTFGVPLVFTREHERVRGGRLR